MQPRPRDERIVVDPRPGNNKKITIPKPLTLPTQLIIRESCEELKQI